MATKQFDIIDELLLDNDLREVKLIEFMTPNDAGKMVPHIKAEWQEAKKVVNMAGTGFKYYNGWTEKVEEINKYFRPELFVAGIAQRKDFIKAGYDKQVEAYKAGLMHPAMYKKA